MSPFDLEHYAFPYDNFCNLFPGSIYRSLAFAGQIDILETFSSAGELFFYGYWDWRFLGLIAASSVVNHILAVLMWRTNRNGLHRLYIVLALVFNLGMLGFFKYYGFFVMQAYQLCAKLGITCSLPLLDIVLPVGISFFTFQAMSYVLDVYRDKMEPAPHLLDFAVYLSFFPQLVAGPIVRARVLLPQFVDPPPIEKLDFGRAGTLILAGLFKKIVIANFLAKAIVDPVSSTPRVMAHWTHCLRFMDTRSRFIAIFRPIRISPSASPSSWDFISRSISMPPIWRHPSSISGGAGTYRYQAGSATISISRWEVPKRGICAPIGIFS